MAVLIYSSFTSLKMLCLHKINDRVGEQLWVLQLDIVGGIGHPEDSATMDGAGNLRGHIALSGGELFRVFQALLAAVALPLALAEPDRLFYYSMVTHDHPIKTRESPAGVPAATTLQHSHQAAPVYT